MLLLGLLIACLAACASAPRVPASAAVAAPPLRVGTSGDYPPFSVRASDETLDGFDVAVARAYGRDRGRTIELVPFAWRDLERRLVARDFDVVMSGVTVRGDRLAIAPMTATVARTSAVLVVPASRAAAVPFDAAGTTVAVNRGGHLERVARARLPRATLHVVDDNRSLPQLLASGTVEAVVTDTLEVATFRESGVATRVALVLSEDRKAYWVAPGNDALADDLDAWLAARTADGTLSALRARYRATAPQVTETRLPDATEGVVDLVARRLMLMPEVASAKAVAGLPIEVPAREADVLERARDAAAQAGLAVEPYVALIRTQMEVAKAVQRAVLEGRASPAVRADAAVAAAAARLDGQLRPAIDRLDARIRAALAAHAPLAGVPADVAAALLADAPVPGFDAEQAGRLAGALLGVPAPLVKRGADSA